MGQRVPNRTIVVYKYARNYNLTIEKAPRVNLRGILLGLFSF